MSVPAPRVPPTAWGWLTYLLARYGPEVAAKLLEHFLKTRGDVITREEVEELTETPPSAIRPDYEGVLRERVTTPRRPGIWEDLEEGDPYLEELEYDRRIAQARARGSALKGTDPWLVVSRFRR